MLDQLLYNHGWLRKLWVDGGFSGEDFANHEKVLCNDMDDEVVKRSATSRGRSVVEALGGGADLRVAHAMSAFG
jgi:hypothetical protein